MNKEQAKKLSEIFGSNSFKFNGLTSEQSIKIVKIQIAIDPIAEELQEAIKKAHKAFLTPRLEELYERIQAGMLSDNSKEALEFMSLQKIYDSKYEAVIKPLFQEKVTIEIPSLTKEDFKALCEANDFTGSIPKLIYTLLVKEDENKAK